MADDLFSSLPPELADEAASQDRKRQIALALLKQVMGGVPQQQQGRILAKTPMSAILANVASQGLAQHSAASADEGINSVRRKGAEMYSQGVEGFNQAPDKKQALAGLMASQHPALRAFASAQEKARWEQEKFNQEQAQKKAELDQKTKDEEGRILREAIQAASSAGDTVSAVEMARTGKVLENYKTPARQAPVVSQVPGPKGEPITAVTNFDKFNVPSMTVRGNGVTVNNGPESEAAAIRKTGATEAIKNSGEVLKENRANAQKAIQGLQSSERILATLQDPQLLTGAFAEPRLFVAKLGELLGLTGPEGVAQTQNLMSELANQTLAQVRRLPGAITEKERPFLEMAAAGKLDYTPEALRRLAEISQVTSHNELMDLQEQYNQTIQIPGVEANAQMFPFPKGWKFQTNPETMEPQGTGSDRWRMKLPKVEPKKAGPAGRKPISEMTRAEKLQLLKELEGTK